ncbi:MAG: acyl-CoA reductase [Bacteroidota bacterium]
MPLLLEDRIQALTQLGRSLTPDDEQLVAKVQRASVENQWFTKENIHRSIDALRTSFLEEDKLRAWTAAYQMREPAFPRRVGLVLAGNIPMVGFHDLLSVFITGHVSLYKLSDKDKVLLPFLLDRLAEIEPKTKAYFERIDRLANFDAVIATGSDNSSRYFDTYFGKYPNIIRKNRSGLAILDGSETTEDLVALGKDVFWYFGLGCRNVAKLMVPKGYDFTPLLEALHTYNELVHHNKYKNNFDYNYTLYILNKMPHLANGCVLLLEDASLHSRIASLHYEYYADESDLEQKVKANQEKIQCIVSAKARPFHPFIPFGKAQQPGLADYADGVDTLAFLIDLND